MGKFGYVLEELHKQTREEFLESLVRAGIYDEDGNLTERYGGKKRVSKEKPREDGEQAASNGAPSKPAATGKTATPSGKSTPTDAAASPPAQEPEKSDQLTHLVEQLNNLSPTASRQALVRAGIIDEEGKLTEKYRQPTKKGQRKKAP